MVKTAIGAYAPDFEIPGADGSVHHLAQYLARHKAIAVVFMGNHCPYVKLYLDRLKQLQTTFAPQGVTLIGINANDEIQFPADSFEKMKLFVTEHQLNFPYLRDVTQDVAAAFGATKTPQAFLLNSQGIICYGGAIDDNAQTAAAVQTTYLSDAIGHLLANTPIPTLTTEVVGCSVKWRSA
jgi:peroxiredoxin